MPTNDYKPRHKKPPAYAGSTPRGPERWARAAHNAVIRPNSKAAQLYQGRVARAVMVRDEFSSTRNRTRGAIFYDADYVYGRGFVQVDRARYYTCSLYCTAMQAQLDFGLNTYTELVNFLMEDERVDYLRPSQLKREVRCQTCGSTMRPR